MSKTKTIGICLLLIACFTPLIASASPPGKIYLLPYCPGDTTDAEVATMIESGGNFMVATGEEFLGGLAAAIFSAVLPKAVSKGVSAIGKGLTDAAKEKQVDSLSAGEHLYVWAPVSKTTLDFRLNTRCIIVTSRAVKDDDAVALDTALELFPTKTRTLDANTNEITMSLQPDNTELVKLLSADYSDSERPPSFIAVFDVELSAQKDEARLVPRFARLEHPLRSRRGSRNSVRTMTLAMEFKTPDDEKPFVTTKAIFKEMKEKEAYTGEKLRGVTSDWFNLPAIPTKADKLKTGYQEAKTEVGTYHLAARLSAAGVQALTGDKAVPPEFGNSGNLNDDCAGQPKDFENEWIIHQTKLNSLKLASNQQKPLTKEIATEVVYSTYYDSCKKAVSAVENVARAQKQSLNYFARTYDVDISVIEYQNRPWVKFWGEVFSDEEVQKAVSGAIVESIDPAKREEASKLKAEEILKLMELYETDRIAAETAIIAYSSASDADKPLKFIDMESKKRKANRDAKQLKVAIPYPESGLWF